MKIRVEWCIAVLCFVIPLEASAQTEFPGLDKATPVGAGTMHSCSPHGIDGDVRCGRFRVYEDRATGEGRTVDLAFVILKASDPESRTEQVLIPLPGGPGQTFLDDTGLWKRGWSHLRGHNDILIADVRGVGESQAIGCPDFEIPIQDRFGDVFPPEHIRMCHETVATRASLDLYITDFVVDDFEELRKWLGYSKVNLIGGSYGTRVGQVYMRRHPEAVRSIIMNSVAPVFMPSYVHMAQSLQASLDLVIQGCEQDEDCSKQYPDLSKNLDLLLERLTVKPAEVRHRGETIQFGVGDFSYAIRGLLYLRAHDVPRLISIAANGEFDELARYYLERTAWISGSGGLAGHHFSALCAEDIAPLTDAEVQRYSEGTFMGDHLISGYRDVCEIWDVAQLPDEWWVPVRSELPVLIISGERDPVTPPAWGDAVAEYLPNSLHVVWPGGGHVPRNSCLRSIEQKYLADAAITDLDVSCLEN